jgi:hypothetical protein
VWINYRKGRSPPCVVCWHAEKACWKATGWQTCADRHRAGRLLTVTVNVRSVSYHFYKSQLIDCMSVALKETKDIIQQYKISIDVTLYPNNSRTDALKNCQYWGQGFSRESQSSPCVWHWDSVRVVVFSRSLTAIGICLQRFLCFFYLPPELLGPQPNSLRRLWCLVLA